MDTSVDLGRRRLLKGAAGGLVIAFTVPLGLPRALAQAAAAPAPLPAPNAFLAIGRDDTVRVLLSHVEMGQGVWTSLPMLLAEELDADWDRLVVEHAPAAPAYHHAGGGMQFTGGSSSVSSEFDRYRQVGAMARALLLQAAADRLGVPVGSLRTEPGVVVHAGGRLRYGELADAAAALPAPATVALKPPSAWRLIGQPTRRLDSPEKITGRAVFGMDVRVDGMLTAVVARPPVFGATVRGIDDRAARAVPGVREVVAIPSGVAVVADHFWAARTGREALTVDWDLGDGATLDTDAMRAEFSALAAQPGKVARADGDLAAARRGATRTLEAEYVAPYVAHAMMEPLNCTVRPTADGYEFWTGTQFQTVDQANAARILGVAPDKVVLHTTFLGGAFGRRATATSDAVSEAAHLVKAIGKPVKTVWTREDDIRGGFYRPLFVHRLRVDLGEDGLPRAWEQGIVGQNLTDGTPFQGPDPNAYDRSALEGIHDSPYLGTAAAVHLNNHSPRKPVPVLWWRSVGHSQNAFVMECAVDELAALAGEDPVAYRRRLLAKHPRHLAALDLAAGRAGWGTPLPEGRARGVAVHESFGSVVAEVAEVSVEDGRIRVHRVTCAVDCGIAVNPLGVAAQMESAIVFGLGAALHGEITLREGRVQQSNFHDFGILRLAETPVIETYIVPSTERPSGVGEPGLPPIAPAVANAVFALTGTRLRAMPFRLA